MKCVVSANGEILGYFLDAQVDTGTVSQIAQLFDLVGATEIVDITDERHCEIFDAVGTHGGAIAYWDGTAIADRPTFAAQVANPIAANGIDTHTTTALPAGTSVSVDGVDAGPLDPSGIFTLTAVTPGQFVIKLSLWPYIDLIYTVEAT